MNFLFEFPGIHDLVKPKRKAFLQFFSQLSHLHFCFLRNTRPIYIFHILEHFATGRTTQFVKRSF